MTLLELLVKELPKRGGWPEGLSSITQDDDGQVNCYSVIEPVLYHGTWGGGGFIDVLFYGEKMPLSSDFRTTIVTREQYYSSIANNEKTEENKVTRFDILTAINGALSIKLDDAMELTETLIDVFDIKHK